MYYSLLSLYYSQGDSKDLFFCTYRGSIYVLTPLLQPAEFKASMRRTEQNCLVCKGDKKGNN